MKNMESTNRAAIISLGSFLHPQNLTFEGVDKLNLATHPAVRDHVTRNVQFLIWVDRWLVYLFYFIFQSRAIQINCSC
jgi:hypothetical protein